MKNKLNIFISAAILCSSISTAAAETHITKQSVQVHDMNAGDTLIVALYNGSMLTGVRLYRGQNNADYAEDMKDIITGSTHVKAYVWNTDSLTPYAAAMGGAIEELPDNDQILYITIGDRTLTAALEDNSSAAALIELLKDGDITINMSDYGNFEKVGDIGTSLPRNDEQITTEPGDLILYQGSSFVIYYDTNTWSFTRLGKINDITQSELKEILGSDDVQVTLSIK